MLKNKKYKQLDVDKLDNTTKQVVIGFKAHPILKIELLDEAIDKGTNLATYVRNIVENRNSIKEVVEVKKIITASSASELNQLINKYALQGWKTIGSHLVVEKHRQNRYRGSDLMDTIVESEYSITIQA